MSTLDWAVLLGTIAAIVGYGLWSVRGAQSAENFLRGGRDQKWWTIGLSIMATQASAITFLSMPGQAYEDGLGFVQFYLGLPVAMVLLSALILPIYYRLKVYTAYEYLEGRFDRRTRQLVALLFLLSRGLAAGVSIYAPAIVLSAVLGWPLGLTNLAIGGVTILYTVSGGTRIVSRTQTYQMVVMLGGMAAAALYVWSRLPPELGFNDALHLAGALGKMKAIDFSPRLDTRYTIWSGLTGGLFVQLAYFGTDQSQVQRYLGGESLAQSRLGLLFNGLVKVPMQFLILFVGVLLVLFHQFEAPPVFFDRGAWARATAARPAEAQAVEADWARAMEARTAQAQAYARAPGAAAHGAVQAAEADAQAVRTRAKALVKAAGAEAKDADYIFIGFVTSHFPHGLVGLLLAVILCAAMSATAAALNALGSTSVIDFYKVRRPGQDDAHYLRAGRAFTVLWGLVAVAFAAGASQLDNLIQAVNILGSIFYGPMLGVFLVGFFLPRVGARPAFWATLVAQALVVATFATSSIGFLWYNVIGCAAAVGGALLLQALTGRRATP